MKNISNPLLLALGTAGSFILTLFGGWTPAMTILVVFMVVDYVTGFLAAAVFGVSKKTATGALSSAAGFRGLCKKFVILIVVLLGAQVDALLNSGELAKNAVILTYAMNELLSILENLGLMGMPVPAILQKAIEVLKLKSEQADLPAPAPLEPVTVPEVKQ